MYFKGNLTFQHANVTTLCLYAEEEKKGKKNKKDWLIDLTYNVGYSLLVTIFFSGVEVQPH